MCSDILDILYTLIHVQVLILSLTGPFHFRIMGCMPVFFYRMMQFGLSKSHTKLIGLYDL